MTSKPTAKGLRSNCLSFPEILAQSIGLISPTASPAVNIPLVYASAGNGAWLAYLIATVGLIFVSQNINHFACRSAAPGSLYIYVARGLGPTTGIVCGWALTLAYLFVAAAVLGSFTHYFNLVLSEFGLHLPSIVLYAFCAGVAWYYAYTDVQLSTVLMLILEILSVGAALILALLVLAKNGFSLDFSQLSLAGTSPSGISLGVVLATFSFVGFESATTLGDEAKSPRQFIPRSLNLSALSVGLFFILLSYTEVLGFRGYQTPLNEAASPMGTLAALTGVDLLGVGLNVAIIFSAFCCVLASITAASRIALALARHSFYPARLAAVHKHNETPHIAVSLSALAVFVASGSMSLFGVKDIDVYGYLGTISTYGFLFAYILVSIAAPVYLSRQGRLRQQHLVSSIIAVSFMMIPVVGSVYPIPAFPYNVFPYLFLMYLAVGAGLFVAVRQRSPKMVAAIEHDLNLVNQQFNDRRAS